MSDNRDFGFCPRCGALMQDGVCKSCGYGSRNMQGGNPGAEGPSASGVHYTLNAQYIGPAQPQKKKTSGGVVAVCIIAGVVLILGLIAAIIFYMHSIAKMAFNNSNDYYDDGYSYYDDDYNYGDYGYYEPDESDPYYQEITDCTRTDLDYKVFWVVDSIDPDDSEDSCSYYATYPIFRGEEDGKFDAVNEKIREMALIYKDSYQNYEEGCSTYGYVTYMDEEKASIVFKHNLYEKNTYQPLLAAVNFRMDTGEILDYSEMAEVDQELAIRFRAQDKTQNDGVEYVQDLSDEELLAILEDPDAAVMFYTPVGLEIGFNYETGWVTVTLKDRAL